VALTIVDPFTAGARRGHRSPVRQVRQDRRTLLIAPAGQNRAFHASRFHDYTEHLGGRTLIEMESAGRSQGTSIEVVAVEIVTKIFPARPSAVPRIREFVQECLGEAPLADAEDREIGNTILRALLAAAGPSGVLEVSCRKYPGRVEFDVLPSRARPASPASRRPEPAASFAEWLAEALRSRGITKESAAEQLDVSPKTLTRWLGGQTEPRLRDLRRIEDRFGDVRLRRGTEVT
jgi:hypothetical protein